MTKPTKKSPVKARSGFEKAPSTPSTALVPGNGSVDPPKKRGVGQGDKRGNRNNLRHGLRGGQLPKDAKYIEIRLNQFRRTLEDAVLATKGRVNIPDAACIQTALRWERHGCLAQRWLNKEYKELKPVDRLKFSEAIAKASESRDRAVKALQLDRDAKENIINTLYSIPLSLPVPNGADNGSS